MFWRNELERLRLEKDLLTLQCDANRLVLIARWQELNSRETWMREATNAARRHPVLVATIAAVGGLLLVKLVRQPTRIFSGFSRLLSLAPVALSVWKSISARAPTPAAEASGPPAPPA